MVGPGNRAHRLTTIAWRASVSVWAAASWSAVEAIWSAMRNRSVTDLGSHLWVGKPRGRRVPSLARRRAPVAYSAWPHPWQEQRAPTRSSCR